MSLIDDLREAIGDADPLARRILDLHEPSEYRTYSQIPKIFLQCDHCASQCHSRSGLSCDEPVDAMYPCDTVKLIAEAYGLSEDSDTLST